MNNNNIIVFISIDYFHLSTVNVSLVGILNITVSIPVHSVLTLSSWMYQSLINDY